MGGARTNRDSEDRIRRLLPFLNQVVDEGLIAMSEVEVIKYSHQDGATNKHAYLF